MRPWAQWTAKTALLAADFAAAAGGLSGVALAAGGSARSLLKSQVPVDVSGWPGGCLG